MSDADGSLCVSEGSVGSRKKRITGGVRQTLKTARYTKPNRPLVFEPCKHNNKHFACAEFRPRDLKIFRSNFFKFPNKIRQDSIISTLLTTSNVKRRRPRPIDNNKRKKPGGQHEYNVSYFLTTLQFGKIPVCKKFFLSVVKPVGRTRLSNIAEKVHKGEPIEEKRGGDRVRDLNSIKKGKVREFIGSLRGTESHYSRNKSKRIYLNCELSIKKLWVMYNGKAAEDAKVGESMFRRIFTQEYNIGFRSPASDVCSTCCLLKEKIKSAASGSFEKQKFMTEKRIHSQRAKAFYDELKANVDDTVLSLCFDLQQIQPLPKTPIQEAFYSRQINLYNMCVTDLKTERPVFYIWTEDQAGKGSLEVSSALLNHLIAMNFEGKTMLRLFCDGCTSQNKNNIVLRSLVHFLQTTPTPLRKILIVFPVRGHSFLPADRVFGRAEKLLRKKAVILSMQEYFQCYQTIGAVKYLGQEWNILNTKDLNEYYKDIEYISKVKRVVIKVREVNDKVVRFVKGKQVVVKGPLGDKRQIIVKGLQNYRFNSDEENFVSLNKKKNFNCAEVVLHNLPIGHAITEAKKNDVDNLLRKMFDQNWAVGEPLVHESLLWYKNILFDTVAGQEEPQEECDCLEQERCDLHI